MRIHYRTGFISYTLWINLKISQFSETYILLMDYPSKRGEELPDYDKNATWNLFLAYIDAHSKIIIDEYPGYWVQAISILQSQCANIFFADQIIYNRLFQKVVHKGRESEINYIKIFQKAKDLSISVANSYSEVQLMHIFLNNFQKGGK